MSENEIIHLQEDLIRIQPLFFFAAGYFFALITIIFILVIFI